MIETQASRPKNAGQQKKKGKMPTVRLMAPFTMKCDECAHFIYKGTKFNARKQSTDERYLGIAIVAFIIRCPRCSAEIQFRTDPKTGSYILTSGGHRIHESSQQKKDEDETVEDRLDRLEEERAAKNSERGRAADALKALEESTAANVAEAERDREIAALQSEALKVQDAQRRIEHGQLNQGLTSDIPTTPSPCLNFEVKATGSSKQSMAPSGREQLKRGAISLPVPKRRKHLAPGGGQ